MAKRKRANNKLSNERRHKEGRGKGVLGAYIPWLKIQDVASRGLVTRIRGIKTGRVHHLLSRLELFCFYCFDWSDEVDDIREQFPLDLSETLEIAKDLGIRHPAHPVTREPIVMTTDFVVTRRKGHGFGPDDVAVNVKYAKDLDKARTLQKLEIERVYWSRRGIKWVVITEQNIDPVLIKNVEWIHSFFRPDWLAEAIPESRFDEVSAFILERLLKRHVALGRATDASDNNFGFPKGVSLLLVRHAIAARRWRVDMTVPIDTMRPLRFAL
jgi:hypothetical protein